MSFDGKDTLFQGSFYWYSTLFQGRFCIYLRIRMLWIKKSIQPPSFHWRQLPPNVPVKNTLPWQIRTAKWISVWKRAGCFVPHRCKNSVFPWIIGPARTDNPCFSQWFEQILSVDSSSAPVSPPVGVRARKGRRISYYLKPNPVRGSLSVAVGDAASPQPRMGLHIGHNNILTTRWKWISYGDLKPHMGIRFFLQRCIPYGDMLPSYQCLHWHGAVHLPDAGVGGVAADAAVEQGFYAVKIRII